jgi:hypothetical protein
MKFMNAISLPTNNPAKKYKRQSKLTEKTMDTGASIK